MRTGCILAACRNGAGYITPLLGNEVKLSTLLQELSEGLGLLAG